MGLGVLVVVLVIVVICLLNKDKEKHGNKLTRVEQRYIEPTVVEAKKVETNVVTDLEAAEAYLKAGLANVK